MKVQKKQSSFVLHQGDCLEVLRTIPDNSIDSVVTDPPYGLSFMAKRWDYDVPSVDIWAECLRVLKPGGHLLAFAGTRTQHRMAVRIEDAGFEIRDMIAWVYGSGMPKHGSCLKPALEPITMARKPAAKATLLNIESCRVPLVGEQDSAEFENNHRVTEQLPQDYDGKSLGLFDGGWKQRVGEAVIPPGRWPANLILDGSEEVLAGFPQTGGGTKRDALTPTTHNAPSKFGYSKDRHQFSYGDTGSAARFFYCAKASKKDRGNGNNHPTVKPTDLMRYLCRLVTPPGGTILDPFMGSGSTGKAAGLENFSFVGIEREQSYLEIAEKRIKAVYDLESGSEKIGRAHV